MTDVDDEALERWRKEFRNQHHLRGYCSIYCVGPKEGWPIKIGVARDVDKRLRAYRTGYWGEMRMHHVFWCAGRPLALRLEREVIDILKSRGCHMRGEWFDTESETVADLIRQQAQEAGAWLATQFELEMAFAERQERKAQKIFEATC